MKDHIKNDLANCTVYDHVVSLVDEYIDYYNNYRYQWDLAKLSPNEFYKFVTTGVYPLNITNIPNVPNDWKLPAELGIEEK